MGNTDSKTAGGSPPVNETAVFKSSNLPQQDSSNAAKILKTNDADSSTAACSSSLTSSPSETMKPMVIVTGPVLKNGIPSELSSSQEPTEEASSSETVSVISAVSLPTLASPSFSESSSNDSFKVEQWDGKMMYADYIRDGLRYLGKEWDNVVMLYESPSSSSTETSFHNNQVFAYHDYPASPWAYKSVLAPCRYSIMNGSAYPAYLRDGAPAGLVEHWRDVVPGFEAPTFVPELADDDKVYAYLPVESLKLENHVNDPYVHYHLAGKDAIHLMTHKHAPLLPNTKGVRPCVAKVTHAMGSKGIFVIRNDEDEVEFEEFCAVSGNPNFVVTKFVDIARNVACHFFIHPDGSVVWIGSNENVLLPDGSWSTDSTLDMADQAHLRDIQLPYVKDVVAYCRSNGHWGFCGVDVLFDSDGQGYVVDVNPRVTGSSPALMISQLYKDKYGYDFGLFRRNTRFAYRGTVETLLEQTKSYNEANEGRSRIVLFGFHQKEANKTLVNIGVYGNSREVCQAALDRFAPPNDDGREEE